MAKVININPHNIMETLMKTIKRLTDVKCATITGWKDDNGDYSIALECPEKVSFDMMLIINEHPYCHWVHNEDIPGHYDWNSDYYIRDCSVVSFRISAS